MKALDVRLLVAPQGVCQRFFNPQGFCQRFLGGHPSEHVVTQITVTETATSGWPHNQVTQSSMMVAQIIVDETATSGWPHN
jgi:hypothetical protein